MAFCPFLAGKRICFGKTFAEMNMRIVALYMSQYFEMELVERDKYPDTHTLPVAQVAQTYFPPIPLRIRLRSEGHAA